MKIICFTESLAAGGAQRQLVNLAVLFKAKGYDVDFLTYRKEDFFKSYLDDAGIIVHQVSNSNYFNRVFSVRKYIRTSDADIVLSFLEVPNFLACLAAIGRHKWKLITTELSAKQETFSSKKNRLFLWFQRFSDKIVCNSKNAENMWRQNCPQYANKLQTIYNPIIIEKDKLQKNFLGEKTHRNIIIPASYQYLKNPIRLIEAINMLTPEEKEIIRIDWYGKKAPMIGNTVAYDDSCMLVEKYQLGNIVRLHEQTTNIYHVMAQADAIGLFSTVEGLPNAVCEGMMLSKPIIMTKISDYEVFSSSFGIILCEPDSSKSIRNALSKFLSTDKQKLELMGKSNCILADRIFSPERIIEQWHELFNKMLDMHKGRL